MLHNADDIPGALMPSNADNVILTFPPRPVSQWEKALLAEWLAATHRNGLDIHRAFVSERRGDDPKILGRIVVALWSSPEPEYLLHSPAGFTFWAVMEAPAWDEMQRFPTLRAALNSIRAVLAGPDAVYSAEFFADLD
jgi:hypothetical protein